MASQPSTENTSKAAAAGRAGNGSPALPGAAAQAESTGVPAATAAQVSAATDAPAKAAAPAKKAKAAKIKPASPPPSTAREEIEELGRVGALPMVRLIPAWLVSAIVHMVILVIFGLMVVPVQKKRDDNDLVAVPSDSVEPLEEIQETPQEPVDEVEVQTVNAVAQLDAPVEATGVDVSEVMDAPLPEAQVELTEIGIGTPAEDSLLTQIGGVGGGSLTGRGDAARKQLAAENGGSDASEAAVALALQWFADHQYPDGSWSFDHRGGKCQTRCKDHGSLDKAQLAATGLVLLPFLGAGQTHKEGRYKKNVEAALYYLGTHMKVGPTGGDMTAGGGSMYGHGICTMALCEAYAMSKDRSLAAPAQLGLNFIMYAQDPVGGGWRYAPRTPGDTSAVGWQIMALKSGHMGFLQIAPQTIKGAENFLNLAQADEGAAYGYTGPGNGAATSAVGLLCRMNMGWKRENEALKRGVERLAKMGPQPGNMYFNYYATQVLHQYEGEFWPGWNVKMRDYLVNSQSKAGHESGSWAFKGDHGAEVGGRVYCTAMATMTLEVYYRYMPIYGKESTEDDF